MKFFRVAGEFIGGKEVIKTVSFLSVSAISCGMTRGSRVRQKATITWCTKRHVMEKTSQKGSETVPFY